MHAQIRSKVEQRVAWIGALAARTISSVNSIGWFTAPEYLPFQDAWQGPFQPFAVGTLWGEGGSAEKAYFKLGFTVPEEARGEKVLLRLVTGGEGLCYCSDGTPWQGVDWVRSDVLVTEAALGGEHSEALLEVVPSRSYWAKFLGAVTFEKAELVSVSPAISRAAFLAETCLSLALALGSRGESLRTERLWQSLDRAMDLLPWGTEDRSAYEQPALEAIELLSSTLELKGEEGRLTFDLMPHSHIDTAWLWPFSETVRKCGRTFSTVLNYMRQYPDYRFIQSQPALYRYTQQHFPSVYHGIKQRVAEGRWEPTGAMWVEPDMNMPSGESLVRQLLLGNTFFQREFGARTRVLWLPDVFGYSAALPQIMRRAGVPYFITHKLGANDTNRFPYAWFRWEGIDGTRVLAYLQQADYDVKVAPSDLLSAKARCETPELDAVPLMFGWGDGGGGPTETDIQSMQLLEDTAGLPRLRLRPVEASFEDADRAELPVWRGELYFENHRGTYTTQAAIKRLNRECELSLRDAEMLASWEILLGGKASARTFTPLWESVCLHQFHDVLPGSSRSMVYREAIPTLTGVRDQARRLLAEAFHRLTEQEAGKMAVANTLSWARSDVVRLPVGYSGDIPAQTVADGKLALVSVPAMGLFAGEPHRAEGLHVDGRTLSNQFVRATFNDRGHLVSLRDLTGNREIIPQGSVGNELRLHEDRPAASSYGANNDAWDISVFSERKYVTLEAAEVRCIESGPIRATLRFTYRWGHGEIVQDVSLHSHSCRVEFRTRVHWDEDRRMLRAHFPLAVNADHATYEIQFGHLSRPNHRNTSWDAAKFEVCGHKWADLTEGDFGVAILNDCKYGYGALGNCLSLTLLRATTYPDPAADRGDHEFTYALMPHGDLRDVVREAYALNVPLHAAVEPEPQAPLGAVRLSRSRAVGDDEAGGGRRRRDRALL